MESQKVMSVPTLDLKGQLSGIREEILSAVTEVIDSTQYILGPVLESFEQAIAEHVGAKNAISLSSGTDALLLALMGLGIGPGDKVITSDFSFFASAGVVARVHAEPVLIDIDPQTFNISPDLLKAKLESYSDEERRQIKAIIPVHLYGQCADMEAILEIAKAHNIPLIEDAAQAIGAQCRVNGETRVAGTIGLMGCYSFFPTKNLGGIGDGGMIVTDDDQLAKHLKLLRVNGASQQYHHDVIGGNFRMDPIQAAALKVKLPHLNQWDEGRAKNAATYKRLCAQEGLDQLTLPHEMHTHDEVNHAHIYNQFMIRAPRRDELIAHLHQKQIGARIYYPVPFHMQTCFQYLGHQAGDFPEAEKAASEILSLPIYPELTNEMQEYVVQSIAEFYAN